MKTTEQLPTYEDVEGQQQAVIEMEEVPLNAEPTTTIPADIIEHDSIEQHNTQVHSDHIKNYIKNFKLKLQDTNQNCCICCNGIDCCTLYVGAHIWFVVWFILAFLNIINTIMNEEQHTVTG
eukprot:704455_1